MSASRHLIMGAFDSSVSETEVMGWHNLRESEDSWTISDSSRWRLDRDRDWDPIDWRML